MSYAAIPAIKSSEVLIVMLYLTGGNQVLADGGQESLVHFKLMVRVISLTSKEVYIS
ncbi:hypothetical protein [Chania multitudinisentens]|uniref:hypothetical protein n=1 Tax=Chania multitudinisentens TaxID=1639108 RepID=UPI0003E14169|nr:hypothetical protein [Chania multitudinisentens]